MLLASANPLDAGGDHHEAAGLPEVHREVRLALDGLDPACTGFRNKTFDLFVPESIALAQWVQPVRSSLALGRGERPLQGGSVEEAR